MSGKASIFPGNAHLADLLISRDGRAEMLLSACVNAQRPLVANKIFKLYFRITCMCHFIFSSGVGLFGLLLQLKSLLHELVVS